MSILFSTHITSDLEACADQITYIQNGRIFASLPKRELLAAYRLAECAPARLTPELEAALIGWRRHKDSVSGFCVRGRRTRQGLHAHRADAGAAHGVSGKGG